MNKKILQPLSKEEALKSIRKFRKDFGLIGENVDKNEIHRILKKSGSLSDEVNKMRYEV